MFCIQWVWTATATASMDKKQIILATFATLPLCKCVFQIGHAFPNAYEYHEINSKMDPQVFCLHIVSWSCLCTATFERRLWRNAKKISNVLDLPFKAVSFQMWSTKYISFISLRTSGTILSTWLGQHTLYQGMIYNGLWL